MNTNTINFESPAVHSYLSILQNIISRMASDSGSCKTWCITLVSAIVVVVATEGIPDSVWLALIPTFLFLFLDAYYLALERTFRCQYNDFIRKVQESEAVLEDTFVVKPTSNLREVTNSVTRALKSFSIWPFYGMLVLMLILARYVILS